MIDYRYEMLALERIISEKKSYSQVLLSLQRDEKLSAKRFSLLKENLHQIFKHYFTLSFECLNTLIYEQNSLEFFLGVVALGALRYGNEESDTVLESYQETFTRCKLSGNAGVNASKLEEAIDFPFSVPLSLKENKIRYYSLMLQVPPFVLKKLSSDIGFKRALDVLDQYRRKNQNYYLLLNDDAPIEDFIELPDKMKLVKEDMEKNTRKCNYVSERAYSLLNFPSLEPKVLMLGKMHTDSYLPIAKRLSYCERAHLDVAFDDQKKEKKAAALIADKEGIQTIYSELYLLKTYLPFDHYDDVIVLGKSTEMGKRRAYIFPALEEKDLLSSITTLKAQLKESAPFVRKGGTLLFLQHSLLKEEGEDVIQDFLANNKDFILIEEKHIYADESLSDSGYYCLLKKKEHD